MMPDLWAALMETDPAVGLLVTVEKVYAVEIVDVGKGGASIRDCPKSRVIGVVGSSAHGDVGVSGWLMVRQFL